MEKQLNQKKNIFTQPKAIVFLALFTCFLWGSAFPAIKKGYIAFHIEDTGSQILFAGYRFFLAGILTLILVSILEKKLVTIKLSSAPSILLQGILQTTLQYVCFYIGLSNTTATKGSIINGANVFFSIIAAHIMMKSEKLSMQKIIGCIIGFAGVIAVNLNGDGFAGGFAMKGEGMILLCCAAYGVSSVTLKLFSDKESPNAITAYQLLFGGAILIAIGWALDGQVTGFNLSLSLLMLYLAMVSTVSFCLWANLLKYNPIGKITIFGFSIPAFGVILSAIFLGENAMSLTTFIALAFVSAGIVVVNKEN